MTHDQLQPPPDDSIEAARSRARTSLRTERGALERRRVRRFLTVTVGLLAASWLGVALWLAGSDVAPFVRDVSVGVMTLLSATTGAGWWLFRRHPEHGPTVVLVLLYLAALVPICSFYVSGEFESTALALALFPVVMAPMFTAKRHAWALAAATAAVYLLLIVARHFDVIPYGYMVEVHHEALVKNHDFLVDTVIGFLIIVFGLAYLSGQASLDILTSQKDLEDEVDRQTRRLARTNAELADRNRALDEFNAALSHDLKSPLQTAMLAAEALIYGKPDLSPEQRDLADTIVNSSSRMADLTRELLKLSRMTDVLGDGERVSVKDAVDQVIEDLGPQLARTRAELLVVGELPHALANPSLLREALQNLLENALKYGDQGGPRIRVEAVDAPWGRIAFAVEDNGPGIPEDQRDLVFRPFLRLTRDKNRAEGVGAGLAIVQRIVSVHGGRVRVEEGRVLCGARFVVELSAYGSQTTLRD